MDATPTPTRENPTRAVQKLGNAITRKIPMDTIEAPARYNFRMPTASIKRSEKNLDKAIKVMKIRYPKVKISSFTTSSTY